MGIPDSWKEPLKKQKLKLGISLHREICNTKMDYE